MKVLRIAFCLLFFHGALVGSGCGVGGIRFSPGTGDALTIDAIASSTSSCDASEGSDFYFGRIGALDDAGLLFSGVVRFQLCRSSDSAAFFKDFTLEHFSVVNSLNENTAQVTSRTDLEVTESIDTSSTSTTTNYFQIVDADLQYGYFEIDFGKTDAFGELIAAPVTGAAGGVIFTSDLSTMAGGDNESFIFIAQKIDSLDNLSTGDVDGNWDTFNFTVSGGTVSTHSTSTVEIGSFSDNLAELTGENSEGGEFSGMIGLNDATSGGMVYQYTGTTGSSVDGALIASPDNQFALGFDFAGGFYFAAY